MIVSNETYRSVYVGIEEAEVTVFENVISRDLQKPDVRFSKRDVGWFICYGSYSLNVQPLMLSFQLSLVYQHRTWNRQYQGERGQILRSAKHRSGTRFI